MEWVETTGRTVEEAKDAALDQLGVDEQDAEFEVVEEARVGLFGRLRAEARVRARVRPTKPRPKDDRRDRPRRRRTTSDDRAASRPDGQPDGVRLTPASQPAGLEVDGDGSGAESVGASRARAKPSEPTSRQAPGSDESASPGNRNKKRRPPGSPRAEPGPRTRDARDRSPGRYEHDDASGEPGMDVALEDQAEVARAFLSGLVDAMQLEAAIEISAVEDETVELALAGADLGMLIGPKGATLSALQDLTRTVVQRKTSASNGRLFVDVQGYRQKRRLALERFASRLADEVKESGARKVLEPMSAADRKVVHDTVGNIDGVATLSEGEDPRRYVVIYPVID